MIELTLNGTADLFTFIEHERNKDGNIVVKGETWKDVVEAVRRFNLFDKDGKDGTTEDALDRMIKRFEAMYEVRLLHSGEMTFDEKAKDLFTALMYRDAVSFGGAK